MLLLGVAWWSTRREAATRGEGDPSAASVAHPAEVEVAVAAPPTLAEPLDELANVSENALGNPSSVLHEGLPVAGQVEVEGGLPTSVFAVVVALAHRPGVSRLHSLRFETPLAADGTFALEVPSGTRSVSLDLDSAVLGVPDEVEVRPDRSDVVLRAKAYAAVRGRVLSPPGAQGADRAWVYGSGVDDEWPASVQAEASGRFTLAYLPFGTPLSVWALGDHTFVRLELESLKRGEVREVELQLEPWKDLHGVVLDDGSAPIADAWVTVHETEFEYPLDRSVRTAADGRFRLEAVSPSANWIDVQASGYEHGSRRIQMPDSALAELRFVLGRLPRLSAPPPAAR